MKTKNIRKKRTVATIGPAVLDIIASADNPKLSGKRDGEITFNLGGGAANTARAASNFVCVKPILMIANDEIGDIVRKIALKEFGKSVLCPAMMESTRSSVISGNSLITKRSASRVKRLSQDVREACASADILADILIVSPMTQADYGLIMELLKTNSNSILQLSSQQIENAGMCIQLTQSAMMLILNEQEAALLTGRSDPVQAIMWIREKCAVKNVVVTSEKSVIAFCDGSWIYLPSFKVRKLASTVGAGDVFTGTLAAILSRGDSSWRNALNLALAAASMHLENKPVNNLRTLQAESLKRKRVPFRPKPEKRATTKLTNSLTVLATSLIVGFTIAALM